MIRYDLLCEFDHAFEGWFRDSADYDDQRAEGVVECPACGSSEVRKAIMAPAVMRTGALASSSEKAEKLREVQTEFRRAAKRAREFVEKNFHYVGDKFAEEARAIHFGEKESRDIYGEATAGEVKALVDEGVPVAPAPGFPARTRKKGELN
ncbi:MAG: DUF1178 family protein [Parvularculaceae bacterium]